MTEPSETLHIEVDHEKREIIVTLPETSYAVTFVKSADDEIMISKPHANEDDARAPISLSTFLNRASQHANQKARDLGWLNEPQP